MTAKLLCSFESDWSEMGSRKYNKFLFDSWFDYSKSLNEQIKVRIYNTMRDLNYYVQSWMIFEFRSSRVEKVIWHLRAVQLRVELQNSHISKEEAILTALFNVLGISVSFLGSYFPAQISFPIFSNHRTSYFSFYL